MQRPVEFNSLGEVFVTGLVLEVLEADVVRLIWTIRRGEAVMEAVSIVIAEPQLRAAVAHLSERLPAPSSQPGRPPLL